MGARPMVDFEHGEKAAQRATLIVAALATAKGIIGFVTNSAALLADALHSTVDVLTALGTWIGLKIARRPADERFPYGYYRAESLVALIISAVIILGAAELFMDGIQRIQHPQTVTDAWLAAGMALIASITSYYLSRMEAEAADRANSQALKAVSVESMADTISALVVLVAIVSSAYLKIPWAEGVGALLVAAWVLKIGIETAWQAVLALMDVAPEETKKEVVEILEHVDEIGGFEDLKLRKSGPMVFGEVTITVPADVPVARADEIARRVREYVLSVPEIEDFRVYVRREEPKEKIVVVPVDKNGKISATFATSPRFAVYSVINGQIKKITEIDNRALKKKVRRGLTAAKQILEFKPYAVIVRNIGEISYNTLKEGLVTIYRAEDDDPAEEIEKFAENALEELHSPTVKKE